MARQKANMSDLLKENQKFQELPSAAEQQQDQQKDSNTVVLQNLDTALHQNDNTVSSESSNTVVPQKDNEEIPQSGKTVSSKKTNTIKQKEGNNTKPQSDKGMLSQPIHTVIPQSNTTPDKRDRVTFYLNPGQREKLEELRIEYRKKTGERINEQELIRRVIDRLTLNSLLY